MAGGFGSRAGVQPASATFSSTPGGFGSRASAPAKKAGGHGGIFGKIGHFVASKADLAAHDIKAIPAGLVQGGEALAGSVKQTVEHPLISPSKFGAMYAHPLSPIAGTANTPQITNLGKGAEQSTLHSFEHPLADPFQTLINAFALGSAGAGAAARLGYAADAMRAGDVGSAAKAITSPLHKPPTAARSLKVPKLVAPRGEGPANLTHESVQLQSSTNPAVRAAQAAHDKIVQRSLDRNTVTAQPSRLAKYGTSRVANSVAESQRIQQRVRAVPTQMLERASTGRKAFDRGVSQKAGQLALFLRSAQVTGEEAARYWRAQAARGVNSAVTAKLAKLAQQVHDKGLVKLEGDKVAVNAASFPKLSKVDELVAENQAGREEIIRQHGLMTPEGIQNRLDLVAQKMTGSSDRRQGLGYTPLKTSVKKPSQSALRLSRIPVVGKPKTFIGSKEATGAGVAKGLVPDNTAAGVASATREALRFADTSDYRARVAKFGSDVRRTGDDVLVRNPNVKKAADISQKVNEALGRTESTLNTLSEEEHVGLAAAMKDHLEGVIPGLRDNFQADRAAALGTKASAGYKWVPHRMLGELTQAVTPRGAVTKKIDTVNSAITAATVYFKVGHLSTRAFTNAATSIIQGSAQPVEIGKSFRLWKALTPREQLEALSASGQHGVTALPHAGSNTIARVAGRGAGWWARHIDAPFRFNNLAYEARQAGFTTPDQFRAMLKQAADPASSGLSAAQAAKVDWVLKRANRVSIMYDGLNATEKRFITRAFWFYPWVKGATRFAFHTASEHPFKTAVGAGAGKVGKQRQAQGLGALPSYEYGLIPFGSGANPATTDLTTFTPFGSAADVLEAGARPGTTSGFLNPAYASLLTALTGTNQFGNKTTKPIGDALSELFSPTPEAQIINAALHPSKPTQMFHTTPKSAGERALFGPATPRKVNKAALNKSAAREKSGR